MNRIDFVNLYVLPLFRVYFTAGIYEEYSPSYLKLGFLSRQFSMSADILHFKIKLLTKKKRSLMTSPERSWPSPEKLVSTLLTTNKRTMRTERDSGDCRPASVWSAPVAEEERSREWKAQNLAVSSTKLEKSEKHDCTGRLKICFVCVCVEHVCDFSVSKV
jgi:hypothetical protein